MQKKNEKVLLKGFIVVALIGLMVGLAQLFDENEIIFPEIAALAVGALLAPKQPWQVSKPKLVFLIALHSMLGITLVRFFQVHIILDVIVGVALSLLSLLVFRTSFAPLISATVLPIIIGSSSLIYPVSATVFSIIIVIFQSFLQKTDKSQLKAEYSLGVELFIDLQRLIVISALTAPAVLLNSKFSVAPPLIVAFVELTSQKNKLIRNPQRVWLIMLLSALFGSFSRVVLSEWIGVPLWISAIAAGLIMSCLVAKSGLYFPPVGAIAILPMLIDGEQLILYPLEVATGFAVMVIAAYLLKKFTIPPLKEKKVKGNG